MPTEPSKAEPPNCKRRWFQFSLRTLLVGVTLLAVACAWLGKRIELKRQERATKEAIVKSGGLVGYDYQVNGTEPPGPEWLQLVLGENFFSEIESVSFYFGRGKVTDVETANLRELTNLQLLDLSETSVSDAGLANLKQLFQLRDLNLAGTKVTGAGLRDLKGLSKLETLAFHRTDVGDAGLENLKELTNLHHLYLQETHVTDAGLIHLRGLSQLKYLDLRKTEVTGEGVNDLQKALPNCRILH